MITVTVIGRLGADPDAKEINGKELCNLRVASKEFGTTEWIGVVCYGKDAAFCKEYLNKGDSVAISGRLQTRKWTDKNGLERYTTEVIANRVEGVGSKGGTDAEERPF